MAIVSSNNNELPYSQRFCRNSMLLAGVWFGQDKLFMLTFLKPFHTVFHQLETSGVCILNLSGKEITLRAILLCGTCDLPACCSVCNSTQFNGFYGCLRCWQPGKSVRTGKCGYVHVFPFNENDLCGRLGQRRVLWQMLNKLSNRSLWLMALKDIVGLQPCNIMI